MTTFAKKTFNVAQYLKSRPTYPKIVYDAIYDYHGRGKLDHAVDLGCGPGFVAVELASRFAKVTAVDPSVSMLEKGIQPGDPKLPRVEYKQGDAQNLGFLRDGEVDLVVAAQAAHWFDYDLAWPELARVVRPGGTVAFVGYAEMLFPGNAALSALVTHHSSSPAALGPYWTQPGRSIVEKRFESIPFPTAVSSPSKTVSLANTQFTNDITNINSAPGSSDARWDGASALRILGANGGGWLMSKKLGWESLEEYLRTWSSLHAYHEAHPSDAAKKGGGKDGDIVDRLVAQIREVRAESTSKGTDEIEVAWPLVMMMIKRK